MGQDVMHENFYSVQTIEKLRHLALKYLEGVGSSKMTVCEIYNVQLSGVMKVVNNWLS